MTLTWPPLNLWAVLVAALATFFLGGLWYSALFRQQWLNQHGYTPEQIEAMMKYRPPMFFFGGMLLAYLLMATLMGLLVHWTGAKTWMDGALIGLAVWGVVVAVALTDFIATTRKPGVYFIDCSYQFIYLVMTGVILAVWRAAS